MSFDRLRFYYEKMQGHEVMFNAYIKDDFTAFIGQFVQMVGSEVRPTGLMWDVDDVGMFRLTDVRPTDEAHTHFVFWDGRLRGREQLCREMIGYLFDRFKFHRLYTEVPLYSRPTMKFVERLGLVKEGRKREAVLYHGEWWDANVYSVINHEVSYHGELGRVSLSGERGDTPGG